MCRSRRELCNEYLLAKFDFDTAENEPGKVCPLSLEASRTSSAATRRRCPTSGPGGPCELRGGLGFASQRSIRQTVEASFSAVSKPIFASKYSFFSISRDLQDLHTFAPLQIQNLRKISSNFFHIFLHISAKTLIFRQSS